MFLVCLHWLEKTINLSVDIILKTTTFVFTVEVFFDSSRFSLEELRLVVEDGAEACVSCSQRRIWANHEEEYSLYTLLVMMSDEVGWNEAAVLFRSAFKIPLVSSWSVPQIWKADENGSQNWAMLLKSLTQTWGASWSSWCHCGQSGVWVMWGKILYFLLGAPSQGDANAISYF